MKKVSKILCSVSVLIVVLLVFCTDGLAASTKQVNLSDWKSVILSNDLSDSVSPDPSWKVDSTNTSVTQIINAKPSAFIGNIECNNSKIEGSFSVDTAEDDDLMGFVFGYKDIGHYYLFDWKETTQNYGNTTNITAKQGMSVKLINTNDKIKETDLWKTEGTENKVKLLYHNNITYKHNTVYNFILTFTSEGSFNIIIKQGNQVLDNISINDNTFTSGKFGFYNQSQNMVKYKGFITEVLSPVLNVSTDNKDSIKLTWNEIEEVTSYNVKRSTVAGGPYTTIASGVTDTNYLDTNASKGATYYYIVTANKTDGESGNSNEVSAILQTQQAKLKVVLEISETLQLSVDDDLNVNKNMSWSTSDSAVATVNEKGVVTALSPGNTIITVKSTDGTYSDYINVLVVEDASDYRLAIDLKIGQSARLIVDDLTNSINTIWQPMDSAIANVTSKGKVTALKKGLVLVTAKDDEGNIIGQVYVRVRE